MLYKVESQKTLTAFELDIYHSKDAGHYTTYVFEKDGKEGYKNFRDESGKIVARTYRAFKKLLNIESGSAQANMIIEAIHNVALSR